MRDWKLVEQARRITRPNWLATYLGQSHRFLAVISGCLLGTLAPPIMGDQEYVEINSPQCEAALARSALPDRLRDRAVVYVWEDDEYGIMGSDDGDFHCLVARNHPESIIPMCVSQSGAESVLPGEIFKAELVMNGMHVSESTKAFDKAVAEGKFISPTEPGISYMMSAHNKIYQPKKDSFWAVPAHVMMFAPYVDREAVGSATFAEAIENPGVPVTSAPGVHSFIITFVKEASSSDEVNRACVVETE